MERLSHLPKGQNGDQKIDRKECLRLGSLYFEQDRNEDSVVQLTKYISSFGGVHETDEFDPVALEKRGRILCANPNFNENGSVHLAEGHGLGNYYINKDDNQNAVQYYTKAVETDPKFSASWFGKCDAEYNLGMFDKAYESCLKGVALRPNDPDGLAQIADCLVEMKKYEEALDYTHQSLSYKPTSAYALRVRGKVYFLQEKYQDALSDYEDALTHCEPGNRSFRLLDLGRCHFHLSQYTKSLSLIHQARLDIRYTATKVLQKIVEDLGTSLKGNKGEESFEGFLSSMLKERRTARCVGKGVRELWLEKITWLGKFTTELISAHKSSKTFGMGISQCDLYGDTIYSLQIIKGESSATSEKELERRIMIQGWEMKREKADLHARRAIYQFQYSELTEAVEQLDKALEVLRGLSSEIEHEIEQKKKKKTKKKCEGVNRVKEAVRKSWARMYCCRACVRHHQKELLKCWKDVQCAVRLDSNCDVAHFLHGMMVLNRGEQEEALKMAQLAMDIRPNVSWNLFLRGRARLCHVAMYRAGLSDLFESDRLGLQKSEKEREEEMEKTEVCDLLVDRIFEKADRERFLEKEGIPRVKKWAQAVIERREAGEGEIEAREIMVMVYGFLGDGKSVKKEKNEIVNLKDLMIRTKFVREKVEILNVRMVVLPNLTLKMYAVLNFS